MKTYIEYIEQSKKHYESILIKYAAPPWAKPPVIYIKVKGELINKSTGEVPRAVPYTKFLDAGNKL